MSILSSKTLRLAITGLVANKTRTALSMLGIVIGVVAVIVIVSVGQGLKVLIVDQITVFGDNMMSVSVKVVYIPLKTAWLVCSNELYVIPSQQVSLPVGRQGIPSMLLLMLILFKGFLTLIGFEMTNLLEQASRA